jgi:hypothetical protein
MDKTKIHLSDFERDLLNNSDWILTKNHIIKKAQQLLAEVQQHVFDYTHFHPHGFPPEVITVSPKISKGENYMGLPWLMLDYPRYFNKENIFAIRTLFWWGNFFSTSLHLSGKYKKQYARSVIQSHQHLAENKFYCCINDDPWQHHFEKDNYVAVREIGKDEFAAIIEEKSFIKLSARFSFSQWDDAITLLSGNFIKIAGWLN